MTDAPDDRPDDADATGRPAPTRAPRPGAAAASRARRIGGRPIAGPRPGGGAAASEAAGGAAAGEPAAVDLGKQPPAEWVDPEPETDATRAPAAPEAAGPDADEDATDTTTTPATEDTGADAAPAAGPGPGVPPWLNWAPAGVLVAGCVVLAVLLLAFSHGVWWGPDRAGRPDAAAVAARREQVLAAAKSCVVTANQYDYRTLPAYEKRALACTTGAFTAKLKRTIESLIMVNAPQLKAKQTPQINRGAIESVSPDGTQWTLLIFGQLSVVNANFPKGRTDPFGAEVRMEKAHGKWLISDLEVVSSPVPGS